MKLLSIDTSTRNFSIALSEGDKIIRSKGFILKRLLSASIISHIQKILAVAQWDLSDIDGFAIGLGPGSFTSLRIGLSTVKAFSLVNNKPLMGIPSLEAIAMNVKGDCSQICVVSDARRNMVYSCLYKREGLSLCPKGKYLLAPIQSVLSKIKGRAVFVGDGIGLYEDQIKASGKVERIEKDKVWFPHARQLASIAIKRYQSKQFDDKRTLLPLYLYADDCQVNKAKGQVSKGKYQGSKK